jgi:putative salt-induced outer membrane protein YdiY/Flp pilus assembly protein TadD
MKLSPPVLAAAALVLAAEPAGAQDARSKADALLKQGIDSSHRGDGAEALDSLLQAQSLYRQMGDKRGEAAALGYLATIYEYLGEERKAVDAYEQSLPLLHAAGDKAAEAAMLNVLGKRYRRQGEAAKALTCFQQSLALLRDLKDREGEAAVLYDLGGACSDLGEDAKAMSFYQQALQRELGKPGPPTPSWTDKVSVSFVDVGGNAVAQTFGLSNEFTYHRSEASSLAFQVQAVRVATRTTSYSATGSSPSSFTLATTETNQVTTADYVAKARFAHDLSGRLFWFTEGGWERNIPAGIESRTTGSGGLGYWWIRTDTGKFRTDFGAGYTNATPVVEAPGFQVNYATWNAMASYEQKIGAASVFTSNLSGAAATKDIHNFLVTWLTDFSVNLSTRLALKVGYMMTYNNRPASAALPILQAGTNPPAVLGRTFVTLKNLDTQFTTSLVVSF